MKLEREKNIAAFRGKNWLQKWALWNKALERDPSILRLMLLKGFFLFLPLLTLAQWLGDRYFPHYSFWVTLVILIVFWIPIDMAFDSLFILPRVRRHWTAGAVCGSRTP